MDEPITRIVVLGAGSAGLMTALALHRAFPTIKLTVVHCPDEPIIGVGESTTVAFPQFVHQSLGILPAEFFPTVRPSWKLGIRFIWGDPTVPYFDYPFDSAMSNKPPASAKMPAYFCLESGRSESRCASLMDQQLSPCFVAQDGQIVVNDAFGYHVENEPLVSLLWNKINGAPIDVVEGRVVEATRQGNGAIIALRLNDDRHVAGDLFVDASGFRSRLLREELQVPFVSYASSLYCDTAVIGSWRREAPILPYTTAETMSAGWCWQIEFPDHVTRGYVFSSAFITREAAEQEFRARNPAFESDVRFVPFDSGRSSEFWTQNVVAIGNAAGFTEPLEATALHLVIEQIRLLCRVVSEGNLRTLPGLRAAANHRFRLLWDEVRDFLSIHFRFNRHLDTPFWQHCQRSVDLGGAAGLVELFQEAGPSTLCTTSLPSGHVFGYDGFMSLLVGQRVPTRFRNDLSAHDRERWDQYRQALREQTRHALPMRVAIDQLCGPGSRPG